MLNVNAMCAGAMVPLGLACPEHTELLKESPEVRFTSSLFIPIHNLQMPDVLCGMQHH